MGALRKFMPITAVDVHRRLARDRRRPAVRRLLVEGRDPRPGVGRRDDYGLWAVGVRRRAAHRVLHDPPGVPGLLRRRALVEPHDRRRPSATGRDAREASRRAGARSRRTGARRRCTHRTSRRGSMTFPLVVLAGLRCARRPDQPAVRARRASTCSTRWLEPVFRGVQPEVTPSFSLGFALSTIALAIAASAASSRPRALPQRPRRERRPIRATSGSAVSPTCSPTRTTSTSASPSS